MSSFFKKNMPGKAKRNEIPDAIKTALEKILNVNLIYTCTPDAGVATVNPSNEATSESVKISELYDMSQINFINGDIPVTKLYLKSGVNSSADGLALQAMVSVVREGLCKVFLKDYFVDYSNSELGKRHEYTIGNEKKVHYDTYTGHFFYLIPRSCGLATFAEVKNKAIQTAKANKVETEENPIADSNPVVSANEPKEFSWG